MAIGVSARLIVSCRSAARAAWRPGARGHLIGVAVGCQQEEAELAGELNSGAHRSGQPGLPKPHRPDPRFGLN